MKYVLLLAALCLLNCDDQFQSVNGEEYYNVGNGVYYFSCKSKKFAVELAKFSATHTIVSIAGDGSGYYGKDNGYYVVCEE